MQAPELAVQELVRCKQELGQLPHLVRSWSLSECFVAVNAYIIILKFTKQFSQAICIDQPLY